MSKNHQAKQDVSWQLVGAVAGGLLVYGAVRLCRRLAALPQVQRAARFVGSLFAPAAAPRKVAEAETVFQSEPTGPAPAAWAPSRSNLYGPN